jgi:superfamily I DNA/RNA helicase
MSRWLSGLNPEQREAVETIDGPLLVLAGAGSGKTRVITHRIAHMLERGIAAERILGVTFTNKAAEEMRQRLSGMVGSRAKTVTLSTFHSLGLLVLRREKRGKRGRAAFTVFDAGDQRALLRELSSRMRFERRFDLGGVLARISAFKNAFVEPEDVAVEGDDPYAEAAALLYPRYQESLEAYAAVDFDDLVCLPTKMMERSPECRHYWSERFGYVLVDEYQDTNAAQLRLLQAIAGTHRNLCVVGDDDQAIYGWRGAEVKHILGFERDFPGARVVYLQRNYRSVGSVLELANTVIARNEARHPKRLVPTRDRGRKVKLVISRDGDGELAWVSNYVSKMVAEQHYGPGQIAVLYRSAILARGLESELRQHGVRYRLIGGTTIFDRAEVKDLIAYLRICANPSDEVSLRRAINSPARGIGPRTVARLAAFAEAESRSLYWAATQATRALPAGDRALSPLRAFIDLIERTRARVLDAPTIVQGVRELLEAIDLYQLLQRSAVSPKAATRRWDSVQAFIGGLERYVERSERPTLSEFLSRLALTSSDDDTRDERADAVTLSTLHGAKGLEFPLVLLIGAEDGILPHDRTMNPHENDHVTGDVSEERRLCYVGLTRAMDELVITHARQRAVRGRQQPRTRTRFLDDVSEELLQVEDLTSPPPVEEVKAMMADLKAMLGG